MSQEWREKAIEQMDIAERGGPFKIKEILSCLDDVTAAEAWVRERLKTMPLPIRKGIENPVLRRRRVLQHLAAELAAQRGEPDELVEVLREEWLVGGGILPLLRLLIKLERRLEAATLVRYALAAPHCPDRTAVEGMLVDAGRPPNGWAEAVTAFAKSPTVSGWEELFRFVPEDVFYIQLRNTLSILLRLGVDPNVLFSYSTRFGIVPDTIGLAQDGLVDPETVLEHARSANPESRSFWLGLAAEAANARGDLERAAFLLATAFKESANGFEPLTSAMAIRESADEAMHRLLESLNIPRYDRHADRQL